MPDRMSCAHNLEPLANAPFQITAGAASPRARGLPQCVARRHEHGLAWMDYCKRCGERHWYVRGPQVNELEEQPRP
jgi:hypothetical protein